jgi:hypothetical protein
MRNFRLMHALRAYDVVRRRCKTLSTRARVSPHTPWPCTRPCTRTHDHAPLQTPYPIHSGDVLDSPARGGRKRADAKAGKDATAADDLLGAGFRPKRCALLPSVHSLPLTETEAGMGARRQRWRCCGVRSLPRD